MSDKTALIGLHDPDVEMTFEIELGILGYKVIKATSIEDMLDKMKIPSGSPDNTPPSNPYDLYVIDANYKQPGEKTCEPSLGIFKHIEKDYKSSKVKFVPISGRNDVVKMAQNAGMDHAMVKDENIIKNIKEYINQ